MSIGGLLAAGLVALLPHLERGPSCPAVAITRDDHLWEIYKKTPKQDAFGVFELKDAQAAQARGMGL